ncbi:YheC/YheD family protein [Paenibacillus sp. D2_2]|uniref:YheC/YheD family endospore coat-associated protein n=1 Tax=Paenibacillus sp. D2_2 TaxID=3073092 RepID=UPI0028168C61|nr:YheC/YheD family protein [Paenibacillus sp. D2_2]WMT39569.1 YheC/YheD family protein [Paenibacillus sp. D2_2]
MAKLSKGAVGILVARSEGTVPFAETAFCRNLCIMGEKQGLEVYVFSPVSVNPNNGLVAGYFYEDGRWGRKWFSPPDIVYDRYFSHDRKQLYQKQQTLSLLKKSHPFIFLTRSLSGKWAVYQTLGKFPQFTSYLPETTKYQGSPALTEWLHTHQGEAFLKPQMGTQGRRTLHVKMSSIGNELHVTGRAGNNNIINRRFLSLNHGLEWIDRFIGRRPFLLQPYLELSNTDGEPFDIRVLMQKNETGHWQQTGMAARVGRKQSVTSNLHGGGSAHKALPFLIREYGSDTGSKIAMLIQELAAEIPMALEIHFGRLAELGIDFGVDREGNIWILEVNSKPGRTSFVQIGDMRSARKSIQNPMGYARYLLHGKS